MNVRLHRVVLGAAAVLLVAVTGCGGSGGPAVTGDPPVGTVKQTYASSVQFRARGDAFEIGDAQGRTWRPFFVKGVNLGIAKPGYFPGELAATSADYARWLERIAELNCNVVRLYTLHFPAFYEAFGAYNRAHPDRPIYLIQGIWLDELQTGDYITDGSAQLAEEIAYVVSAVHGDAVVPERLGKAYGEYRHDVSSFVLAWLPGHEMDGSLVKATNDAWPATTRYEGRFVSASNRLPIEAWVAKGLDQIVTREVDGYGAQRPVGWANWPALDPIHHPTEPAAYEQDLVDLDLGQFTTGGGFDAGIFVSYHVYPFNPEFIGYDPGYAATIDDRGRPNSYLGYLVDLKAHHRGVPLLVAEFGVPSSMGNAHVNATSYNHGGYSESEQAAIVPDLLHSIVQSGAAGAIAFEFIDEWFKNTWMTYETTLPHERKPLWQDMLSPEQSFGLVSFYPTASSVTIDGDGSDWAGRGQALHNQPAALVSPLGDGHDAARTLLGLQAGADPAYLFLRLDTAGTSARDFDDVVLLVGISTLPGATGDRLFPDVGVQLPSDAGLEAVVVLDASGGVAELRIAQRYDMTAWLNGGLVPGTADRTADGQYVLSTYTINSDRFYREENLPFVPAVKQYSPGVLRRGNSTTDSLSNYQLGSGILELRLPWHALWVTDPSSHQVLDDRPSTAELETTTTPGIQLYVVAAARGTDGTLRVVDALPRGAYANGQFASDGIPSYSWSGWNSVDATERVKPVFRALADAYGAVP